MEWLECWIHVGGIKTDPYFWNLHTGKERKKYKCVYIHEFIYMHFYPSSVQ